MNRLPEIIGLCGIRNSGKDTAGYYLRAKYGYYRRPVADEPRRMFADLTGLSFQDLCGLTPETRLWRSQPNELFNGKSPIDALRDFIWAIKDELGHEVFIRKTLSKHGYPCPYSAVTDVRYPYEIEAIQRIGGIVFYVYNPRVKRVSDHKSENAEAYLKLCDLTVVNDGSFETFYRRLDNALERFTISQEAAA